MKKKPAKNQIIGTWKLISIFYRDQNGNKINLYGENPKGILMYDQTGNMNAQLGFSNRKKMSTAALSGGTIEEKAMAFGTYMAYYGKYYEKEPGIIIHEVEGCTIPNWVGESEIRYVEIEKNMLYISTPKSKIGNILTKIEVVWEKVT